MGYFCRNSQHVNVVVCFCRGAPSLIFYGILSATLSNEKISTTGVTQWNLELPPPPFPPVLFLHNLGLAPRPHFLEGELIHWVGMAKTFG